MKKRILLFLLISTTISSMSKAQVLDGGNPAVQAALGDALVEQSPLANFFQRRTPMMDKLLRDHLKDDDGIERHYVGAEIGSAYEYEEFKPGKVFYREEFLGDFYYRHNAYNSEIELRRSNVKEAKQEALIKNKEVSLKDFKGREMRFLSFTTKKGKTKEAYLTKLVDGEKYNLYHRLVVKFTEAKPAANSMVNPTPSRFSHFVEFYTKEKESDNIEQIPLKTGKFLKMFGKKKEGLQELIKKEKLDLETEKDLVLVFNFLNR
ncbi:MAG: hypothetical protein AB3N14_18150 [Flavobacteriaceae bacterium]